MGVGNFWTGESKDRLKHILFANPNRYYSASIKCPEGKQFRIYRGFSSNFPVKLEYFEDDDIFFLNSRYKQCSNLLFTEVPNPKAIYFDSGEGVFHYNAEPHYTFMACHAMDYIGAREVHFLDLGCSDGLFCISAYLRGASRITGVEIGSKALETFKRNIDHNQLDSLDFRLVNGDISKMDFNKLDLETVEVVCANLGKGQYKGNPDEAAIRLLKELPRVKFFIGSGYSENKDHSPADAVKKLEEELGFGNFQWIIQDGDRSDYNKLAFISEKL